jgi:hypothetical protein
VVCKDQFGVQNADDAAINDRGDVIIISVTVNQTQVAMLTPQPLVVLLKLGTCDELTGVSRRTRL